MVCARHLANHGVSVDIVLDRPPERLTNPAAHQYRILDAMNTPITVGPERLDVVEESTIVIDALIGYGLDGDVQDPARTLIQSVANEDMTIVSLDVPSGIDATTGETLGSALAPDRVITLALPKTGLVGLDVPLYLADIGIPRVVYDRLGIQYENPFSRDGWVELHGNHS